MEVATREMRRVERLSDALNDEARTVAAFTSTLFARHLVCHFAGSRAFGTEVLSGTGRSGFWIVIRGVRPKRI